MIARSMVAGAALFTILTGTSFAQGAAAPSEPTAKANHKEFTDGEGNTLGVDLDDAGKVVKATAKNRKQEPLAVAPIPLKDFSVCIPKAKSKKALCQPLAFITDGAFFKMGTATCSCYVVGGTPYCYGNTCH